MRKINRDIAYFSVIHRVQSEMNLSWYFGVKLIEKYIIAMMPESIFYSIEEHLRGKYETN